MGNVATFTVFNKVLLGKFQHVFAISVGIVQSTFNKSQKSSEIEQYPSSASVDCVSQDHQVCTNKSIQALISFKCFIACTNILTFEEWWSLKIYPFVAMPSQLLCRGRVFFTFLFSLFNFRWLVARVHKHVQLKFPNWKWLKGNKIGVVGFDAWVKGPLFAFLTDTSYIELASINWWRKHFLPHKKEGWQFKRLRIDWHLFTSGAIETALVLFYMANIVVVTTLLWEVLWRHIWLLKCLVLTK